MVTCPKCNAPESGLRWQFWRGNAFRCTLCDYLFMTETDETENLLLEFEHSLLEFESPVAVPENILIEEWEPLTDIFEENNVIKIYIGLIAENEDEIRLRVAKGQVEIAARNLYKLIDLPECNMEQEKIDQNYKNGVLEIIIPKKTSECVLAPKIFPC